LDPDLVFVLGVGIFAMCFPLVVNAFSTSGGSLRPAALALLIGGSMIFVASSMNPGGYTLSELPDIIRRLLQ
jgi:hypothetical protein